MPIARIEAFIRGLPRRVPAGSDENSVAVREATTRRLAQLNADMLGRDLDERVPVALDEIVEMVTDRMDRYTSADWSRNGVLDRARKMIGEIAADLRSVPTPDDDESED